MTLTMSPTSWRPFGSTSPLTAVCRRPDSPMAARTTGKRFMDAEKPERWPAPERYGSVEGLQSMGGIAAPLLAGFSITLATVVLTAAQTVRWPGLAVFLASLAAISLVGCVQFISRARGLVATPDDMRRWWDDADTVAGRPARVREIRRSKNGYDVYARRAGKAYNFGIVMLLASLATVLVPADGARQPQMRWIAAAITALAALFEVLWTALPTLCKPGSFVPNIVRERVLPLERWLNVHAFDIPTDDKEG